MKMHSICENCEKTRIELNDVKNRIDEFQNIAKQIVQTDFLFKKYSDKEKECESIANELSIKKKDYDQLTDSHRIIIKENESIKKQNKDLLIEKNDLQKRVNELNETLNANKRRENDLEKRIDYFIEKQNSYEEQIKSFIKDVENLRLELKLAKDNHRDYVEKIENEAKQNKILNDQLTTQTSLISLISKDDFPGLSTKTLCSNQDLIESNQSVKDLSEKIDQKQLVTEQDQPKENQDENKKVAFFYLESSSSESCDENEQTPVMKTINTEEKLMKNISSLSLNLTGEESITKSNDDKQALDSLTKVTLSMTDFNQDEEITHISSAVKTDTSNNEKDDDSLSTTSSPSSSSSSASDSSSSSSDSNPMNFDISDDELESNEKNNQKKETEELVEKVESAPKAVNESKKETEKISQDIKKKSSNDTTRFSLSDDEMDQDNGSSIETRIIQKNDEVKNNIANDFKFSDSEEEEYKDENNKKVTDEEEFKAKNKELEKQKQLEAEIEKKNFIEEILNQDYIDKFIDKEMNDKYSGVGFKMIKNICDSTIDQERIVQKNIEKQIIEEFKQKYENEVLDDTINKLFQVLIKECCERVIYEAKEEKVTSIYNELVEVLIRETINDSLLLEMVFDDMIVKKKPFINELVNLNNKSEKSPESTKQTENKSNKRQHSPESSEMIDQTSPKISNLTFSNSNITPIKKMRKMITEDIKAQSPSITNKKTNIISNSTTTTPQIDKKLGGVNKPTTPSKEKSKTNIEDQKSAKKDHQQFNTFMIYEAQDIFKDFLADYFRKYNFKHGFTFDELNSLIDTLAQKFSTQIIDLDSVYCSQFISNILVTHYMNNRFVPLDALKLKHQEETEHQLFRNFCHQKRLTTASVASQSPQTSTQKKPQTSHNYSNYLQSRLDNTLNLKITVEEDKYVYLIKKLKDYQYFSHLLDEFLNRLKLMILGADYNDFFNIRMTRMICFLCKDNKYNDFLNVFIYDLIATKSSTMPTNFYNIIILIARIWPESLVWPSTIENQFDNDFEVLSKKNPVLNVIIHIVKNCLTNCGTDKISSEYYIYTLETLCNWINTFKDTLELWDFFKTNISYEQDVLYTNDSIFILNDNEFKLNPVAFEYLQAIKLMCLNEGCSWTLNVFLKEHVSKELDFYTELSKSSSQSAAIQKRVKQMIAYYLFLKGNIISHACSFEKDSNSDVIEAIKSYSSLLTGSQNNIESFIIDCSILESLLLLAPYDTLECFIHIHTWLLRYKSKFKNVGSEIKLSKSTENKIKYAFNLYKNTLPNYIVIVI